MPPHHDVLLARVRREGHQHRAPERALSEHLHVRDGGTIRMEDGGWRMEDEDEVKTAEEAVSCARCVSFAPPRAVSPKVSASFLRREVNERRRRARGEEDTARF